MSRAEAAAVLLLAAAIMDRVAREALRDLEAVDTDGCEVPTHDAAEAA